MQFNAYLHRLRIVETVLNLALKLLFFFSSQQESIQLQLSSFPSLQEEDKTNKDDSEKEKEKDKNKDKSSDKNKIRMLSKGEFEIFKLL